MPATLLFCVGAAKCGTSWLYEVLRGHPECHLRSIKELHYFGALDDGLVGRQISAHEARRDAIAARIKHAAGTPAQAEALSDRGAWLDVLGRGREETDAYLDYLDGGRTSERVIGDVTPAYALLTEARLRAMARLMPDVRFVYLIRDPVERLWSHVRMMAAQRGHGGHLTPERADRVLRRTLAGKESEIARRGDYIGAIRRLTAAVDPSRLMIAFYEEMIAGDGLAKICRFIGIAPVAPAPVVVNPGEELAISGAQIRAATDWLAPQYEFVRGHMGYLPDGWAGHMKEVS